MNIAVTAATGHLGGLVVQALLDQGVPAANIVAVVRNPDKAAPLAAKGVTVRRADYNEPEALAAALVGVDRVLLVSGLEPNRAEQHRHVVAAARGAGVGLLAYTSILNADTTTLLLAADHKTTEAAIRDAGVPFVFLRNGWYLEGYTGTLAKTLERGVILGSAGDGRVSAAARADYAEAAAAVLTGEGHENKVYELGGDESFSMAELAAEVSQQGGTDVVYRDLPVEAYTQALVGAGIPEGYAALLADSDRGIAAGELFTGSGDLHRLIGRPTTPLADAVSAALEADSALRAAAR